MERDNNEKWGNIELPGLSDDILLSPNLNKILANRAKAKDPNWRKSHQSAILNRKDYKKKLKKAVSDRNADPEYQRKFKESIIQREQDPNYIKKMTHMRQNRIVSEETGKKISESKIGKSRPVVTCPHCTKQGGVGIMQRYHFDNCKMLGKSRETFECSHCLGNFTITNFKRWHGDNCKKKSK